MARTRSSVTWRLPLRLGYTESGPRAGTPALICEILTDPPDGLFLDRFVDVASHSKVSHVVLCLATREAPAIAVLEAAAGELRRRGVSVEAVLPTGVVLSDRALAAASSMVLRRCDVGKVSSALLDPGIGSFTAHAWPGGAVLDVVTLTCPCPLGRFLILEDSDSGIARTWIASKRGKPWTLLRTPVHSLPAAIEPKKPQPEQKAEK